MSTRQLKTRLERACQDRKSSFVITATSFCCDGKRVPVQFGEQVKIPLNVVRVEVIRYYEQTRRQERITVK